MPSRAVVVFALALVVRLGVVGLTPNYQPTHDDRDYSRIGWSLAEGRGYPKIHVRRHGRVVHTWADAYRPPLWPIALGTVYAAVGKDIPAARLMNAVLGAFGAVLMSWIALRTMGERAAWWAGIFGAVYLPLALVSASLVSETLFVAAELLALALALEARERRRLTFAACAGAAAGMAELTRTNGAVILLAVLALVLVPPGRRATTALVTVAACIAVVGPWTLRNAVELHAFVPVSTESGVTLLGTYNATSMSQRREPGEWRELKQTDEAKLAHQHHPPAVRDKLLRDAAISFIKAHPAYPFAVAWHNLRRFLDLGGRARASFELGTIGIYGRWVNAELAFAWALAALALAGLLAGVGRGVPRGFWIAPLLLLVSTLFVNAETPRFRAPIDPFLILLAAGLVARVSARFPHARWRRARVGAGRATRAPARRA